MRSRPPRRVRRRRRGQLADRVLAALVATLALAFIAADLGLLGSAVRGWLWRATGFAG